MSNHRCTELTTTAALVHVIGGLIVLGYAQNYYFHLRQYIRVGDKH